MRPSQRLFPHPAMSLSQLKEGLGKGRKGGNLQEKP